MSTSAAHDPFRQDKSFTQLKIRVTVFTSFGPMELMIQGRAWSSVEELVRVVDAQNPLRSSPAYDQFRESHFENSLTISEHMSTLIRRHYSEALRFLLHRTYRLLVAGSPGSAHSSAIKGIQCLNWLGVGTSFDRKPRSAGTGTRYFLPILWPRSGVPSTVLLPSHPAKARKVSLGLGVVASGVQARRRLEKERRQCPSTST